MISIDYDSTQDLVLAIIEGETKTQELMEQMIKLGKMFGRKKKLYMISDYSNAVIGGNLTNYAINLETARQVFMESLTSFEDFYLAHILDPSDEKTALLLDQFLSVQNQVSGFHPKTFYTFDDALEWIKEMRTNTSS